MNRSLYNPLPRWNAALLALSMATTGAFAQAQITPPALDPGKPTLAQPDPKAVPKPASVLAGRPDVEPATNPTLLGARYESRTAGISFNPPADCKQMAAPNNDEIVEFSNEDKNWLLRVSRPTFPTPVPLSTTIARPSENKPAQTGLLDYTAQQLQAANPGAKVLRQDVINVDANYIGMIALRFTLGTQRWLRQQALYQVNDQLYYILNLTTPAGKVNPGDDETTLPPDPSERIAVETFNAMIDSIKLIDRAPIKEDQNQRLFRTRALFLYWTPAKFDSIKVDRQYLRLIENGKDVGYAYVEEMPNDAKLTGVSGTGAVVYERSHQVSKNDKGHPRTIDIGSFKFMSFDRKREGWTRTTVEQSDGANGPEESHTTEYAEEKWETKLMFAPESGVLQKEDNAEHHAPLMRPADSHVLDVSITAKGATPAPVHLELPPFYLPQAGQSLLPRLVIDKAFHGPRTYLFASYMPETRDIRLRYVDVSVEQDITFAGRPIRAHAVTERVGIEGDPVVHYVNSNGRYLGSENRSMKTMILPTDEATILKQWPDAKLTRPDKMKREPAPGGIDPAADLKAQPIAPVIR
jgi:hypothetical protein